MRKELLAELKLGYTSAIGKIHIVKSEKNPERVTSYCGKILIDIFYMTTTGKISDQIYCKYCDFMYNKERVKSRPIGGQSIATYPTS